MASRDSNLPPGVNDRDIPGNRPEDEAYDRLIEGMTSVYMFGYHEDDILAAWREVCREHESFNEDREEKKHEQY